MGEEIDVVIPVCKYIYNEWVIEAKSQRDFASTHGIEESTVRRIKNVALGTTKTDYNMSLKTLYKICKKKGISLEQFFKLINE